MKGRFFKSAIATAGYPRWRLPEIAFVGRSNVGKSSLINHLLKEKLAKTSATPGKTQLLNFFNIEDKLAFVDLPGYGYAKVPGQIKKDWSKALETYLAERENLRLILMLLDIRRTPTENDRAFAEWAQYHNKPLFLVFTKCDKVKTGEKQRNTAIYLKTFQNAPYIHYTIKEEGSRRTLIKLLKEHATT